jgi:hypothetical protein
MKLSSADLFPRGNTVGSTRKQNAARLEAAFGRRAAHFDSWLVDVSALRTDFESLETLIGAVPPAHVLWKLNGRTPDARMRYLDDLPDVRGALHGLMSSRSTELLHQVAVFGVEDVDGAWASILDRLLDFVREALGSDEDVQNVAFGFQLSAPGSVTQLHVSSAHRIQLQISGNQRIHTLPQSTLSFREQREVLSGQRVLLDWHPAYVDQQQSLNCRPGNAVYIPALAPQWTEVETDAPSLSVSCGLYTRREQCLQTVYKCNT